MAVTTVTSTAAALPPHKIHAGLMSRSAKYVHAGTFGDIVLMFQIPSGVDIVGVYGKITTAQTAANATVGIQGNDAIFGSLASGTSPVFAGLGAMNYRLSLSDDAVVQSKQIVVSPTSGTWTITASIELTVLYQSI